MTTTRVLCKVCDEQIDRPIEEIMDSIMRLDPFNHLDYEDQNSLMYRIMKEGRQAECHHQEQNKP